MCHIDVSLFKQAKKTPAYLATFYLVDSALRTDLVYLKCIVI